MKKRILLTIILLLLTTGCTCEYNLIIDGNIYKEKITIIGETSEEIANFNNEWKVPIDKEEYDMNAGLDGNDEINTNIYKYNLSGNKLNFNYDFNGNQFSKSTAVYNCYNKLTVTKYNNTTIISTSSNIDCFNKYPNLNTLKINIKVDREVISNNADSVSGNTYTWNFDKYNPGKKGINLVLENKEEENKPSSSSNNNKDNKNNSYVLYIFLIIIILIIFIGYKWFMKFKDKNNNID